MSIHVCPPDHKHGDTRTCYTSHACRCDECRTATKEYAYYQRHMHAAGRTHVLDQQVDATGTRRRIQALMCLGWSHLALERLTGIRHEVLSSQLYSPTVTRSSANRMVDLYDRLSLTTPPTTTTSERISVNRTRALARRRGWAPPLAWDDIDNDDAPAELIGEIDVDEVAVELALAGRRVRITPAERRVCVRILHSRQWSDGAIAAQLRCADKTVGRIRDELNLPAWSLEELEVQVAA